MFSFFSRFKRMPARRIRKSRSVTRRFVLEPLEDRSLPSSGVTAAAAAAIYGQMPLAFEVNQGQDSAGIDYIAHSPSGDLALSGQGATIRVDQGLRGNQPGTGTDVLSLGLVGSNSSTRPVALDPLITRTNYLSGNDRSQWHTNIPNFGRVEYPNVYPGIDMVYYGNQGRLEYDFVVASGTDPSAIRLAISGARRVTVDGQGNLVLHSSSGDVVEQAPVVYQTINGVRHGISGRYAVMPADSLGNTQVGFQLGAYDHTLPLDRPGSSLLIRHQFIRDYPRVVACCGCVG
jgi:hypothetical protein